MAEYFVAPTGDAGNDGTFASPWSFAHAITGAGGEIVAGDTMWMRGGTYTLTGETTATIDGASGNPVVFRAYEREVPIIDTKFRPWQDYVWYRDLRFAYLQDSARVSAESGSNPTDIDRQDSGIVPQGTGVKFIHCQIDNLGDGVFGGNLAVGLELCGCITFNVGWDGPDRGHGHLWYLQNGSALTPKVVRGCIGWGSYGYGFHIYGSDAASLRGFDVNRNAVFWCGIPNTSAAREYSPLLSYGGADGSIGDADFDGNTFRVRNPAGANAVLFGGTSSRGDTLALTNNRIYGKTEFQYWGDGITATDNVHVTEDYDGGAARNVLAVYADDDDYSVNTINDNAYYQRSPLGTDAAFYTGSGGPSTTIADFRSETGYDLDSTLTTALPTGSYVTVWESPYETGRAHVTIENWDEDATVDVDLSAVLEVGQRYTVHHVFDHVTGGAPVLAATYDGNPVAFPMTAKTPPTPYGGDALAEMDNTFGVFVVRLAPPRGGSLLLNYLLLLADALPSASEGGDVDEDDFCGAIGGGMIAGFPIAGECDGGGGGGNPPSANTGTARTKRRRTIAAVWRRFFGR